MNEEIEKKLRIVQISPTPVRIMIYKCLEDANVPLSLSDIELRLDTVDKSTVSRTLNTFKDHHLIHSINDGSGSVKYELCKSHDKEIHDDQHIHFRCEKCGITSCLTSVKVPVIDLPHGYKVYERSYLITGICPKCSCQDLKNE